MNFTKSLKIFSFPVIISAILFNINSQSIQAKTNNKIIPANEKDIELYRRMGITYVCSASAKGTDQDFKKSLSVAASLYGTVLQQKHGGLIKEGKKKEQKLPYNMMMNNVTFQLLSGTLQICPNNVPKEIEKQFKDDLKRIQELNKK